jgi:hypothetical protein
VHKAFPKWNKATISLGTSLAALSSSDIASFNLTFEGSSPRRDRVYRDSPSTLRQVAWAELSSSFLMAVLRAVIASLEAKFYSISFLMHEKWADGITYSFHLLGLLVNVRQLALVISLP